VTRPNCQRKRFYWGENNVDYVERERKVWKSKSSHNGHGLHICFYGLHLCSFCFICLF